MKKYLLILMLCFSPATLYAGVQSHDAIRAQVATFIQQQTAGLSGTMRYQVDDIDPRLVLQTCDALEVFLPSGSRLIGKTAVGVRCNREHGWTIFVPVQIRLTQTILINTRQLPAGHVMSEEDLSSQSRELSQLGGLSDPVQVVGKVLRYSIAAGQMLNSEMLRPPYSVKQGQTVQLLVQGGSFSIRSSGVALNDASAGQYAKVRNYAGGVVGGIAQANGVVEIAP